MRITLNIVASLLVLAGIIWFLQGVNVLLAFCGRPSDIGCRKAGKVHLNAPDSKGDSGSFALDRTRPHSESKCIFMSPFREIKSCRRLHSTAQNQNSKEHQIGH